MILTSKKDVITVSQKKKKLKQGHKDNKETRNMSVSRRNLNKGHFSQRPANAYCLYGSLKRTELTESFTTKSTDEQRISCPRLKVSLRLRRKS